MRLIDAEKLDWWYKGRNIRRVIDDAPTVDAVVVTRCKDCAHLYGTLCTVCGLLPQPDDFCSYGERKGGES